MFNLCCSVVVKIVDFSLQSIFFIVNIMYALYIRDAGLVKGESEYVRKAFHYQMLLGALVGRHSELTDQSTQFLIYT